MKKIFFLSTLIFISIFSFSQIVQPNKAPNFQQFGSSSTMTRINGVVYPVVGMVNGTYQDTTAANANAYVRNFPYVQIVTNNPKNTTWLRDSTATRWVRVGQLTSLTFITDSSVVICYNDGHCDTLAMYNFTNVVNNLIQNFNDSTVYHINDSTLIICNGQGVCDTIHLRNSFTYNIYTDSLGNQFLVTCDTLESICISGTSIGDSCYQQHLCDTIPIPRVLSHQFQEGIYTQPGTQIHEIGDPFPGEGGKPLYRNTYINANPGYLTVQGRLLGHEPFAVNQGMLLEESPSIQSWYHIGRGYTAGIDNPNTVNLYMNYTDPFYHDSSGFVFNRIGYLFNTNGRGARYRLDVDNISSKQTGLLFHTLDTANRDAVTIFGTQTPKGMNFPSSPHPTSTWYENRIAVFKTTGQVQFPKYGVGSFTGTATYNLGVKADGSIIEVAPGGSQRFAYPNEDTLTDVDRRFNTSGFNFKLWNPTYSRSYFLFSDGGDFDLYRANEFNNQRRQLKINANGVYMASLENGATPIFSNINVSDDILDMQTWVPSIGGADYESVYDGTSLHTMIMIDQGLKHHGIEVTNDVGVRMGSAATATPFNFRGLRIDTSYQIYMDSIARSTSTTWINAFDSTSGKVTYIRTSDLGLLTAFTADNGLTANTATNVQLFGTLGTPATLLNDRYLTASDKTLNITGTNASSYTMSISSTGTSQVFKSTADLSNTAIVGTGVAGIGVNGVATTGDGVQGSATSGNGVYGWATTGVGGKFVAFPSSTNTVVPVMYVQRLSSGSAASGIGGSIDFYTQTTVNGKLSNQLISKLTDVTDATRTSQFDITGVNSASTNTIASFYGSGVVGIGISSSYTATRLNVVDNSLAGVNMVNLTSTSTAAASNSQKMLNIDLSGANATASQITYGIYVSNSHSGTSNTNYGVYSTITNEVSGSSSIRGEATAGYGVFGSSSTSYGVWGNSGSSFGVTGTSVDSYGAAFLSNPASTNTVVGSLLVERTSSGTAANNIGVSIDLAVQTSIGSVANANQIKSLWTDVTFATRTSQLVFTGVTSAATETWLTLGQSGYVKFRPMTVTEAGAIATAEGLMVFVSNTDGTFTSIGLWIYENAAWHKL